MGDGASSREVSKGKGEEEKANVDLWEKKEEGGAMGVGKVMASKWRCLVCRAAPSER